MAAICAKRAHKASDGACQPAPAPFRLARMTEEEIAALRLRIAARLAELEAEDATARAGREQVTLDQTSVGRLSRMDALQRQAMSQATARRRAAEIARLTGAARRLTDAPDN